MQNLFSSRPTCPVVFDGMRYNQRRPFLEIREGRRNAEAVSATRKSGEGVGYTNLVSASEAVEVRVNSGVLL
jgi:hypothetical protein